MDKDIKKIQESLISNLDKLNKAKENISEEVARSNALSLLANTYIKSCNLIIRVEESKLNIKRKIGDVINNEE